MCRRWASAPAQHDLLVMTGDEDNKVAPVATLSGPAGRIIFRAADVGEAPYG